MTACEQNQKNRDNLRYCKERGIRLSGPRLGRPPKVKDPQTRKQEYIDAKERNAVEGKLGEGMRRYGLGLIMACLQETSETVIALQFLVINLERRVCSLFCKFSSCFSMNFIWKTQFENEAKKLI